MPDLPPIYESPRVCKVTASQTNNSTTPIDVTGLAFLVSPGRHYRFHFLAVYQSDTAACGLKHGLTVPAFTRFAATARTISNTDGGAGENQALLNSSGDMQTATSVQVVNTDQVAMIDGILVPSAAGTLQYQFGIEVAAAIITIYPGSCGFLWDLGP